MKHETNKRKVIVTELFVLKPQESALLQRKSYQRMYGGYFYGPISVEQAKQEILKTDPESRFETRQRVMVR